MNSDTAFFLDIGFVPVNKSLKIKGSGNKVLCLRSLLLDPWMFRLPGFTPIFHTHIFAPRNIEKAFLAKGYRLVSIEAFHKNVAAFFDEANNQTIHKLDRRKNAHAPDRMTECARKRLFMDHFLEEDHRDEVAFDEVQSSLYQPIPHDLPMDRYLVVQEYRFQQFLRYLVGLRFLALAFSGDDLNLKLSLSILEKMAAKVHRRNVSV